jgi:hypothetical protein|tara:strand:+ start:339 stop:710 length:372 start_codon:yes stop_codon:yes gene_type:complete
VTDEIVETGAPAPGEQSSGWADALPALVLLVLGLAGLATATILTSTVPGQYLILARPGTATGAILDMVYRARGGIVGFGGLPGIALAASDDPGFAEAVRAEGAWIVLPSPKLLGCFGPPGRDL